MYQKYIKRFLDILCSLIAIIVLSPVYLVIAILVRGKLGAPVIFKQYRPGKKDKEACREHIFKMYKFRTMTDEKDEYGKLLPDEKRLTAFGKALRATSLDELPELFNILKGDMSIVGPRPQLVRDMVFMTEDERMRHVVRPGLTGLAQVSGRNALGWKLKLKTDLEYISKITFFGDLKIIIKTIKQVFFKEKGLEGADVDEVEITDDYGDYLLKRGMVSADEYNKKQAEALEILKNLNKKQAGDLV